MSTQARDDVGNRIAQDENSNGSAYSYGSTSNRLYQITGHDAASLDYDAAGNTTIKNDKTFAYNAANRLATITLPGESPTKITFTYSALSERVTKTSPTGTTHFHYDRAGHLIAEADSTGATIREYLWLGDTPIGLVATQTGGSGPELFAVHTDHLATTLRITDNLQQTAWKSTREPFGESTLATTNTAIWPLRFPGQYEDNETGIFYNYFRDYDTQIGRYIESDPIGLDGGINSYAYVQSTPTQFFDEYGLAGATFTPFPGRPVRMAGEQRAHQDFLRDRATSTGTSLLEALSGALDDVGDNLTGASSFSYEKVCDLAYCPEEDAKECKASDYRGRDDWFPPNPRASALPYGCVCLIYSWVKKSSK